jgi:hypothetical protein
MNEHEMMRSAGVKPADERMQAVLEAIMSGAENAKIVNVILEEANAYLEERGFILIDKDGTSEWPTRRIIQALIGLGFPISSLTSKRPGETKKDGKKGYYFAVRDEEGDRYVGQLHQRERKIRIRRNQFMDALERSEEARRNARALMKIQPRAIAYGLGVDSSAMIVGFVKKKRAPGAILFADVGDEKPETYAYYRVMSAFLEKHHFPPITVVRYRPVHATYNTLSENCLQNGTLPSLAFGRKSCSLKFKVRPQNLWCDQWSPAIRAWRRGDKVIKFIGYDAGPKDSRRGHDMTEDDDYQYEYPLREWGWDREKCMDVIDSAGLPVPMKSACWHCPASKPNEVAWLAKTHPELFARAIAMEDSAKARGGLLKIEGLWRKATKKRPGSWREFAEKLRLIRKVKKLRAVFGDPQDPEVLRNTPMFTETYA